jgi:2-polyprenyl-3-methyl-5-hydroxy-6-metoxy-1,4-benzoquinol methylase
MTEQQQAASETVSACPLCSGTNLLTLQDKTEFSVFTTSGQDFVFQIGVGGCRNCGFIFLNPRAGQAEMARYYSLQSRNPRSFDKLDKPYSDLLDHQTRFIQRHWKPSGPQRILDVGCAEGFFLKRLARECGNSVILEGIEPGRIYAAAARALLPDAIIHESLLDSCELEANSYDIITLRHVLEHLLNPIESLLALKPLLAPSGLLHIEIPNVTDFPATISPFYHQEHMSYFTPKTIRFALERCGYRVVEIEAKKDNPIGSGFSYPITRVLAARSTASTNSPSIPSPDSAQQIYAGYVERQREFLNGRIEAVTQRVNDLAARGKRIGIFGAGPHTVDLFHTMKVEPKAFLVALDNNPNKAGKRIRGIPIKQPDAVALAQLDSIVISSAEFESAMVDQIRSYNLPSVEILKLYS